MSEPPPSYLDRVMNPPHHNVARLSSNPIFNSKLEVVKHHIAVGNTNVACNILKQLSTDANYYPVQRAYAYLWLGMYGTKQISDSRHALSLFQGWPMTGNPESDDELKKMILLSYAQLWKALTDAGDHETEGIYIQRGAQRNAALGQMVVVSRNVSIDRKNGLRATWKEVWGRMMK